MSPTTILVLAETIPAVAGAGIAIAVCALLMRGQETRIQHLEHEIAQMHAWLNSDINGPDATPSTPEVSKRYDAMMRATPQDEAA